jgi:hypothetical protein
MIEDGRNANGTFATGNPGGPGRPRRAIEREYLATLADAVPLETWREICLAAVDAAKSGDPKAREWLSRLLLGAEPPRLLTLAADEADSFGPAEEIVEESKARKDDRFVKILADVFCASGSRDGTAESTPRKPGR